MTQICLKTKEFPMKHRDDPMFYDIEIEEIETKKTQKSQVGCWWGGDASVNGLQAMCDCQLGGYFNAKPSGEGWSNRFTIAQHAYLKAHSCSHEPSKKFKAVRAHLPSGEIIAIAA